ncbi:peptidoglycan amidohydrolase family protein [Clostridium sp. MB40-C1]|uniref:peptidoglycan amidohydrolase family protein n=1 Tax=Clostridium sp. MB40-C1 TaxID=3070996 RepID=UPI0027E0E5C3|nr:peptidoglycan amidohydrolase family protein [Clostridium sp. MB40-C1]WMJ79394.1 peptidoglycan amidohydrolase family protein [Clostridium sp. MB40-C1]
MNKKKNFENHLTNLESSEESKKYINEMQEMEEQYEKKSTMAFVMIAIPILILAIITVKQMISFSISMSKNSTHTEGKQIASDANKGTDPTKNNSAAPTVEALNEKIHKYLDNEANRKKTFAEAVKLNSGSEKGASSIFIAQVLRNNGETISKSAINTKTLVAELQKNGWKKITDYKQLKKGDICFAAPSKAGGSPSHTYVFMKWVKEGKTDYAYVCDSQVSEYKNTLHTRNIASPTPKKEKFSFLMRKEK